MRKNCSSDREKLLKFEAEGQEFVKFLRSIEQFFQTVKALVTQPMLQRRPNRTELRSKGFLYPNFMEIPKM
jgi:hypothetical protein